MAGGSLLDTAAAAGVPRGGAGGAVLGAGAAPAYGSGASTGCDASAGKAADAGAGAGTTGVAADGSAGGGGSASAGAGAADPAGTGAIGGGGAGGGSAGSCAAASLSANTPPLTARTKRTRAFNVVKFTSLEIRFARHLSRRSGYRSMCDVVRTRELSVGAPSATQGCYATLGRLMFGSHTARVRPTAAVSLVGLLLWVACSSEDNDFFKDPPPASAQSGAGQAGSATAAGGNAQGGSANARGGTSDTAGEASGAAPESGGTRAVGGDTSAGSGGSDATAGAGGTGGTTNENGGTGGSTNENGGTTGTDNGGAGEAGTAGSSGESGTPNGGTGALAGMGGSSAGSGGTAGSVGGSAGNGGTTAGTGENAGTSGAGAGTAGASAGMGGSNAGSSGAGAGGTTAGSAGTSAGAGGITSTLMCGDDNDCSGDEYCKKASCDAATGVCQKKAQSCTGADAEFAPVCGCDHMTYYTPCVAEREGVNVASQGECTSGGIACTRSGGASTCLPTRSFAACYRTRTSCSGSPPTDGVCWVLPDQCPTEDKVNTYCNLGNPTCVGLCEGIQAGNPVWRDSGMCQ